MKRIDLDSKGCSSWRPRVRKGGKEGRREGGKEGRREGGKEGRKERGHAWQIIHTTYTFVYIYIYIYICLPVPFSKT